ncbi:hypothetical protein GOP47_0019537 [Adiantum capillus-veneris]|uniref:Uncharacterized protein n=1 Tax=Adiantum capillus-veneris TaxID=13818 RepID=A0A9D4UC00_ADICA|nr:hypothetical protein GOP47_0019537 [Adiantum capillus-veneris]
MKISSSAIQGIASRQGALPIHIRQGASRAHTRLNYIQSPSAVLCDTHCPCSLCSWFPLIGFGTHNHPQNDEVLASLAAKGGG